MGGKQSSRVLPSLIKITAKGGAGPQSRTLPSKRKSAHGGRKKIPKRSFISTMTEFQKSSRILFRLIDANASGTISFSEVQRYVESALKSNGEAGIKAKTWALLEMLGLETSQEITEINFVKQFRLAYEKDPETTNDAVTKALEIMMLQARQDAKQSAIKSSRKPQRNNSEEDRKPRKKTGSKSTDELKWTGGSKWTIVSMDDLDKATGGAATPLVMLDNNGNPTNAFILEYLRSVKEAVGINSTSVLLGQRAVDNAKDNLQELESCDSRKVLNYTRAKVLLDKHKEASSTFAELSQHTDERMEHIRASQARIFGRHIAAGTTRYRRALDGIISANEDDHAFDQLNLLAAKIQNVGPLRKGDRAEVVVHDKLVPVEVAKEIHANFYKVYMFKTVAYALDKPYEEGFKTSQEELRLYARVELHTSGPKHRQQLFNNTTSVAVGDKVKALENGKVVAARVESVDDVADTVDLFIEEFTRHTRSRMRKQVKRADIWYSSFAAPLDKKQKDQRNSTSTFSTQSPSHGRPFIKLVDDAKAGQDRVLINARAGSRLPTNLPVAITVGDGVDAEQATVVAFGSVLLDHELFLDHPAVPGVMGAATAGDTRLDMYIYNGTKSIDDIIVLDAGTPNEEEAKIAGFEIVLLRDRLQKPHARNSALRLDMSVKSRKFLAALYDDAKVTLKRLDKLAQDVCEQVKTYSDGQIIVGLAPASLKRLKRALIKSQENYRGDFDCLTDLARMTFSCPTSNCALQVLRLVQFHQGWEILRIKNRLMPQYDARKNGGYRDMLLNVRDNINGHIAEIQINLNVLLDIKKSSSGHNAYKVARLLGLNMEHTTRFDGVPRGKALDAVGCGLTRDLEIFGLDMTTSELAQLYSTRGLKSTRCAIQKLTMHSIKSMSGWTLAQAALQIDAHVGTHMQALTLSNCGLKGEIPEAIATACPNLEELVLQHNKGIVGSIPEKLSEMYFLRILDLRDCNLEGSIPESLGNGLSNLRALYLHNNRLTGGIPASLAKLRLVIDIFLNNNNLSGRIPETFKTMPHLRRLVLSENDLTGPIPKVLSTNEHLQLLLVDHNRLSGPIPDGLLSLKKLQYFAFNGNKLVTKAPVVPHETPRLLRMTKKILAALALTSWTSTHGVLAANAQYRRKMLKATGVSALELKNSQLSAYDLAQMGFDLDEMCEAGFTAQELNKAHYSAKALKDRFDVAALHRSGYELFQLKAAGFSAYQLYLDASVSVSELIGHCDSTQEKLETIGELKKAGCPPGQLNAGGSTLEELRLCGFTASEMKKEGFALEKLITAGFVPVQLKAAEFTATELKETQKFTLKQLKEGNFTAVELKEAKFSLEQLQEVGFPLRELKQAGFYMFHLLNEDFTLEQLKDAGFTATELKPKKFTLEQFKAVGFALEELKEAKFSATELKEIGFTFEQLVAAGFTAAELREVDFTLEQLQEAGFTAKQLKEANFTEIELKEAGFTLEQLKEAGFALEQLKAADFGAIELMEAGFTIEQLKASGFTAIDLQAVDLTLTLEQLQAIGLSSFEQLQEADLTLEQLKALGFTIEQLKEANYTAAELKEAGFTLEQLKEAGFTVTDLGFTIEELKEANFTATQLKETGFTLEQLVTAGFTLEQLKADNFTATELRTANFSLEQLIEAGFTATELKEAGFTLEQLKTSGFTATELGTADFTLEQLKASGFSLKQLEEAEFTLEQLQEAGFAVTELKEAGHTLDQLKEAGFTVEQLKEANYTAIELKEAGFTLNQLKAGKFTASELRAAFFSPEELEAVGFTLEQPKTTDLTEEDDDDEEKTRRRSSLEQYRAKNVSATELKGLGYTPEELKDADYTLEELKEANFPPSKLKKAGFTLEVMIAKGFTVEELKAEGFTATDLKEAGFTAEQLKEADFTEIELKEAGFTS